MRKILLYSVSAVEAWDIGLCRDAHPVPSVDLDSCVSSAADLRDFKQAFPYLSKPIHILVAGKGARRNSAAWQCHTLARSLPRNSFWKLDDGVFVAAPYLCFIQLASHLTFAHAALLGMEFCGRYSTLPQHVVARRTEAGKGMLNRPQLTTAEQLKRYTIAYGLHRNRPAARSVGLLMDGARSPRESALHVMLHASRSQGGFGLGGYELNGQLDLTSQLSAVIGADYLECDFLWRRQNLAVEYDGKDYHTADHQRTHDNMRRSILSQMGIRVVNIDKGQMGNPSALESVVGMVSEAVCEKPVPCDPMSLQKRARLQRELLEAGLNLYRERGSA